jgi:hypothetical protein
MRFIVADLPQCAVEKSAAVLILKMFFTGALAEQPDRAQGIAGY